MWGRQVLEKKVRNKEANSVLLYPEEKSTEAKTIMILRQPEMLGDG